MCGIFGVIQGKNSRVFRFNDYMDQACKVGYLRGEDSTGLFQVDKDNRMFIAKLAMDGPQFTRVKQARNILNDANNCPITIGHHRQATHGRVCHDNAHPFWFIREDKTFLVGVHNGVINSYKKQEDGLKFEVDSEWALYKLFKEGSEAYKEFSGFFAFAYYDSLDDKFRLSAGNGRQLHYAHVNGEDAVVIGSESGMVNWIAERNNISISAPISVGVNTIIEFPREKLKDGLQILAVPQKPQVTYSQTKGKSSKSDDEERYSEWTRARWARRWEGDDENEIPWSYDGTVGDDIRHNRSAAEQAVRSELERVSAAANEEVSAEDKRASRLHKYVYKSEMEQAQAEGVNGILVRFRLVSFDPISKLVKGYCQFTNDHGNVAKDVDFPCFIRNLDLGQKEVGNSFKGAREILAKIIGVSMDTTNNEAHYVLARPYSFKYGPTSATSGSVIAAGESQPAHRLN